MLVHIKQLIAKAKAGGYALGAFNVQNLEMTIAVVRAAEKMKSPIIIQTSEHALIYAGVDELTALIKAAAKDAAVPIALHLDHNTGLNMIKKCVQYGYSSVMIDGSEFSYEKNVKLTKQAVKFAKPKNVWVQGEIGELEGAESGILITKNQAYYTDPAQAARFVRETGVNALAIAIGNIHGVKKIITKRKLKLDLKRLKEIVKIVSVPLVLHGASGFPAGQIKKAVKLGIVVVNIDSELRIAFARAEKKFFQKNKNVFDPRKILNPAIEAMQKIVEKKIAVLGSTKNIARESDTLVR